MVGGGRDNQVRPGWLAIGLPELNFVATVGAHFSPGDKNANIFQEFSSLLF